MLLFSAKFIECTSAAYQIVETGLINNRIYRLVMVITSNSLVCVVGELTLVINVQKNNCPVGEQISAATASQSIYVALLAICSGPQGHEEA